MSETAIVHYVGARQPPLFGTLSTDSATDPLPAGATATFSMRLVNSSTLKIDHVAATVVSEPLNQLRYDWAAADVNTAGYYVGWWTVTISGQTEDSPEFLIWIQSHTPTPNQYVSVAEMKETLSMGGETFADADLEEAVTAASAIVNQITCRSTTGDYFGVPSAPATTRYFTPVSSDYVIIGPHSALVSVTQNGSVLAAADYYVDQGTVLRSKLAYGFTQGPQAVAVSATWGYATVPAEVKAATKIIATQILRRAREAPFGILATSLDGPAIRLGRYDPQVEALLSPYYTSNMIE